MEARWRRAARYFVAGVFVTTAILFGAISAARDNAADEQAPDTGLMSGETAAPGTGSAGLTTKPATDDETESDVTTSLSTLPTSTSTSTTMAPSTTVAPPLRKVEGPVKAAFVPYWAQTQAKDVIDANRGAINHVSPFWYVIHADGSVGFQDEGNTFVDTAWLEDLQNEGIVVLPTISNHYPDRWAPDVVRTVLSDRSLRAAHVTAIVEFARSGSYDGVDIDYEELEGDDREHFALFIRELGVALHAYDLMLSVDVMPDDIGARGAYDLTVIGAYADQVRLMAYTYSWIGGQPGPAAPTDWVDERLEMALAQMPAERLVLGLAAFGYDWPTAGGTATGVGYAEALERLPDGATSKWVDDEHTFRYANGEREVWYSDSESAAVRTQLAADRNLGGVFVWSESGQDPATWERIDQILK